jgi:hypothetical protein
MLLLLVLLLGGGAPHGRRQSYDAQRPALSTRNGAAERSAVNGRTTPSPRGGSEALLDIGEMLERILADEPGPRLHRPLPRAGSRR